MPSKKELEVWTLDENLVLPFVAAYRIFEKALNPLFAFYMQCSGCRKATTADGSQGPVFVTSKQKKNDLPVLIGIQCKTEGCGKVIKFGRPISPGDSDFPSRLQKYPSTALTDPDGNTGRKVSKKGLEQIERLLEL